MTGVLNGHVTIGPVDQAVRPGNDPEDSLPEVYDMSGEELIEQVGIGHDGNYSFELDSGICVIIR